MHNTLNCTFAALLIASPLASADDWTYGIGTGIGALSISGDAGFHTQAEGPIEFDASLDPSEVFDYVSSSLSFAGFITNQVYTFNYSYMRLELEDDVGLTLPDGDAGVATVKQITTRFDLSGEYKFYNRGRNAFSVFGGLYNYEKEYEAKLVVSNQAVFDGSVDSDWTDFYVGLKQSYAFSKSFHWHNKFRVGAGDSDSFWGVNSTVVEMFSENWAGTFTLDYVNYDYENGNRGDEDWFFYDASEASAGIGLMYVF